MADGKSGAAAATAAALQCARALWGGRRAANEEVEQRRRRRRRGRRQAKLEQSDAIGREERASGDAIGRERGARNRGGRKAKGASLARSPAREARRGGRFRSRSGGGKVRPPLYRVKRVKIGLALTDFHERNGSTSETSFPIPKQVQECLA